MIGMDSPYSFVPDRACSAGRLERLVLPADVHAGRKIRDEQGQPALVIAAQEGE